MKDVVYHGFKIRPRASPLGGGGFEANVTIRPGNHQTGATHLILLPERWDSEMEARSHAVEAARRIIDTGLTGRPWTENEH